MHSKSLLALLVTILVSAPETVPAQRSPRASVRRASALVAKLASTGHPGCAVGVYQDGRTLYEGAYGLANLEHGVPINPRHTVFDVGSVSKQFTAASILLLVQDGKLSLADDIRRYMPEMPDVGHVITIDNLLHHTSGLRDYPAMRWMMGRTWWDYETEQESLDLIARQRGLNFTPGSKHTYSNTNYILLAQIVRRVSGKSLAAFAHDRVFAPLGMAHTYFEDTLGRVTPHRAAGYAQLSHGVFEARSSRVVAYGSGGLQTTVSDLARWQGNFDVPRVGGAWLVQQLEQTGVLNDGTRIDYARGLEVYEQDAGYHGLRTVLHNGGTWDGFRATAMRLTRDRLSTIVLCNSDAGDPGRLRDELTDLFIADRRPAEAFVAPTPAPEAAQGAHLPVSDVPARLLGTYWNREDITVRRIEISDGKLWYVRGPESRSELALLADGTLQMLGVPSRTIIEPLPANGGPQLVRVTSSPPVILQHVEPSSTDARALAEYVGVYKSSEISDGRIVLALRDGQLVPVGSLEGSSKLTPVFRDAFQLDIDAEGGLLLLFQRDASGHVTSLTVDHLWARNIVFMREHDSGGGAR